MFNKKNILLVIFFLLFIGIVYSQSTENDNQTTVTRVPTDTGRQLLREMLLTSFEDPTLWRISIPEDEGNITVRRIFGGPSEKEILEQEEQNIFPTDEYVLGIKTEFYQRSETVINMDLQKAMFIPGIAKKLSLWVLGRDKQHMLSARVLDMDGNIFTLPIAQLNFNGWKKLEVIIPEGFSQEDLRRGNFYGMYLLGLKIDTHFEDTIGSYYIYFDDLRVVRDAMIDANKSEDDISDGW